MFQSRNIQLLAKSSGKLPTFCLVTLKLHCHCYIFFRGSLISRIPYCQTRFKRSPNNWAYIRNTIWEAVLQTNFPLAASLLHLRGGYCQHPFYEEKHAKKCFFRTDASGVMLTRWDGASVGCVDPTEWGITEVTTYARTSNIPFVNAPRSSDGR